MGGIEERELSLESGVTSELRRLAANVIEVLYATAKEL